MGGSPFALWRLALTPDERAAAIQRPLNGDWRDEFAILYRDAIIIGRLGPRDVDALEIWELAAILGRNETPAREPWPDDAPSIQTMRRYRALSSGQPVPPSDQPIGDDEYRSLLADAKAGTRKEVNA